MDLLPVFGGAAERWGFPSSQPLLFVLRLLEPLNVLAPFRRAHPEVWKEDMPATRSQADAVAGGAEPEPEAGPLEDAAAEFSAESAARKAAEERVKALEAQLAAGTGAAGGGDRFSTPLPSSDEEYLLPLFVPG